MNLNRAMLIGNLTRDPETKTTPSGQSVCNFGVATNRQWNDNSGNKQTAVEYHNIVAWGKLADICSQYLHKGKKIYIEGRLQTRDWEGQDGVKRNKTEIVAENMIMLDGARGSGNSEYAPRQATAVSEPTIETLPESSAMPPLQNNEEIKVEDLPF